MTRGFGDMSVKQKYRVIERLDVGGMAEVFRGRAAAAEGLEKEVAIKRVLPNLTRRKKFMQMFLDEARLSMRLNHANIVQVFDVGRGGGTYFIVMEYVDGANLRRIFQRASERGYRIPVPVACYIIVQVCQGLAHAHEKRDEDGEPLRIVHRDVSPPNILISRSGEVKLVDFGLAKAATQMAFTDPGVVKGKFSYLSPEAAEGLPIDHRADIFSAGTVLFELLSNRQLFRGRTDIETTDLVRKAEIPPLSKLNPDVPESFEPIIQKALERDPKDRYASARELGDEISRFLFDNNLKVTSYDIQEMYKRLFEQTPEENDEEESQHRIEDLIEEEILNLSMIGHLTEVTSEGSRPIQLETLPTDLSPQYDLSDVWDTRGLAAAGAAGATVAAPAAGGGGLALDEGLTERLEGAEPVAAEESVEERRRREREEKGGFPFVAVFAAAVLLGALAVAIYFWFFMS